MQDAALFALGFAKRFEHGWEDGLGADDAGVGPEDHDYVLGCGEAFIDQVSEGVDVGAEIWEARVGADGGEGEGVGGVAVVGEAVCDEGEAGWCVPCAGDEDEGWFGHGGEGCWGGG